MRVAVLGKGEMGKRIAIKIDETDDLELASIIDPTEGENFTNIESDLVIDFSHPDNLDMLLQYGVKNKLPLIIATTGYTSEQINKIEETSKLIPIIFTANTSLGVNILSELLGIISPILKENFDIEVIEKHHNKKIDSPSGTANYLVDSINESLDSPLDVVNGRSGIKKRDLNEIGVHAIRGGTIAGEHSVLFAGDDEIIELKHTALSKNVFVNGAIKAARFISSKDVGYYTMKDVLNIKGD